MQAKSNLKVMVVGGPFGQQIDPVLQLISTGKGNLAARIAEELEEYFSQIVRIGNYQGGELCTFDELQERMQQIDTNVLVFMPHLPNIIIEQSEAKIRIEGGKVGCIKYHKAPKIVEGLKQIHPEMLLVPFKVADQGTSRGDIARWMLKLHSALAVYSFLGNSKTFFIADALGNDIRVSKEELPKVLAREIFRISHAIRRRSVWQGVEMPPVPYINELVAFSRKMEPAFTNTIRNALVDRWPGNFSFRCAQGFLSTRVGEGFAITIRNVAKAGLTEKDFVFVSFALDGGNLKFWGRENVKPSIDSPVHRVIYENLPWVNGIVHGHLHALNGNCVFEQMLTRWPCGSENEAFEILEVVPKTARQLWVVNVEGHGFVALIGDQNPAEALKVLSGLTFDRKLECCASEMSAKV